ncbi:hypothetical protein [Deinococcus aluminii]|uniref:Uncharacterized protein n=1 Tax=Deinococcus aluminii TaxID=1656885 RepID=A0ABP9XA08_9DEIO
MRFRARGNRLRAAPGIDPHADQNLQTLCDAWNEGKWNPVRHAPTGEQRRSYDRLYGIFAQEAG